MPSFVFSWSLTLDRSISCQISQLIWVSLVKTRRLISLQDIFRNLSEKRNIHVPYVLHTCVIHVCHMEHTWTCYVPCTAQFSHALWFAHTCWYMLTFYVCTHIYVCMHIHGCKEPFNGWLNKIPVPIYIFLVCLTWPYIATYLHDGYKISKCLSIYGLLPIYGTYTCTLKAHNLEQIWSMWSQPHTLQACEAGSRKKYG